MVLGLRAKSRKTVSVQVDYHIHVQEVKPWPQSQSSKSGQSVLVQWENGDENSGSFACDVGDGRIGIGQSFRLPVTLCRESSRKGTTRESFQKNILEFYLYEPRKDKALKGQLLGSAAINLADFGIIKETVSISAQVNYKRSFKSSAQPVIYVNIQPLDGESFGSSPNGSLSKEVSLDKTESHSQLTDEGNDDELEIASFTDDDDNAVGSSQSSQAITSLQTRGYSLPQKGQRNSESAKGRTESFDIAIFEDKEERKLQENRQEERALEVKKYHSEDKLVGKLSEDAAQKPVKFRNDTLVLGGNLPGVQESGRGTNKLKPVKSVQYPFNSANRSLMLSTSQFMEQGDNINAPEVASVMRSSTREMINGFSDGKVAILDSANGSAERLKVGTLEGKRETKLQENSQEQGTIEVKKYHVEDKLVAKLSEDAAQKQVKFRNDALLLDGDSPGVQERVRGTSKLKPVKSVQYPFNSANSSLMFSTSQLVEQGHNINAPEATSAMCYSTSESKAKINGLSDGKVELVSKIERLEEELREAAAVEVALYSVVAEHGSSATKVHAPARRLSRFYLYACKERSPANRASAARTAVSGLVLVAKSCGNDVPRLTFWLSNSILLRAIISQAVEKLQLFAGPNINSGGRNSLGERSSLKRHESSLNKKQKDNTVEDFDDWQDPQTFIAMLENVEAWIFNRIIESVWWQTMTPHMQPAAAKSSGSRKSHGRRYGLADQEQGNFSIDLWLRAFKDACERLCPLRAGGHDCGCLPVLARLVMEQLVSRLDVSMFNAVLRESAEEMPTDPVSDPISDSKVLPIPAGKSSFGSGAQLKNAIGNWSRWLSDLFGIDDSEACKEENELINDEKLECETSFKAFELLNALSDLMMLPLEMLADRSIRKEVCPKLGAPLIKRALNNFVPDEFCPDPIPEGVLEALDSEDLLEGDEDCITSFPCTAAPSLYQPPPAVSLTGIIGELGSQSTMSGPSVLRKSYTSDDELDELDSPITSIIVDNFRASRASGKPNSSPKKGGGRKVVRYQLLREVWRDGAK